MKKWKYILLATTIGLGLLIITNPTKVEYKEFAEEKYGTPPETNLPIDLESINFFVFSAYTPVVAEEYGNTHLGIMGNFIQISDGQFDYPWWLEPFN